MPNLDPDYEALSHSIPFTEVSTRVGVLNYYDSKNLRQGTHIAYY